MTLAVLLSGQGGQNPGMFALTAAYPPAQRIFAAARPLLNGLDPREIAGAGDDVVRENRTAQILCCVAALAGWTIVEAASPRRVILAGYSVGDLAAWGCAGRLDAATVLGLAAARAEAMDAAVGDGFGLAGIRGLPLARIAAIAEAAGCSLAIRNAVDSAVVGGLRTALDTVCATALAAGAVRAVTLGVNVPSHTELLVAATDRFRRTLSQASVLTPGRQAPRLLSGLDGMPVFDAGTGIDKLAAQISQPIDWAACLDACREYGATAVIELGPGGALATMARGALPDAAVHALEDFRSVDGAVRWIARTGAGGA